MANYAIMRFMKIKAAGCGGIEAHNERQKEAYASNPDIDPKRTDLNYHLVYPTDSYRNLCQQRIDEEKVKRVRKDAVMLVETVITASNDFIKNMDIPQQRAFFDWALQFYQKEIGEENIISAVVHIDEKTPHMHLSFVPITKDGRLSAKDIIGNKKKLCEWQDKYYEHMSLNYPDMERGKAALVTGKAHIPTELLKRMERHDKKRNKIVSRITDITAFTSKDEKASIAKEVSKYLKEHDSLVTELKNIGENNDALQKTIDELTESSKKLETVVKLKNITIEGLRSDLDIIPDEVIQYYRDHPEKQKGYAERIAAEEEAQRKAAADKYAEEEKSVLGRLEHRKREVVSNDNSTHFHRRTEKTER